MDSAGPASDDDLLAQFLRNRDAACPLCGYNLRDLTGNRCPECGDHLLLRVNVAEPRFAAAITGLIGLSAGAGLNVLLIIYGVAVMMLHNRSYGGMQQFFTCNFVGGGIEGAALYLWLRGWKRIRRTTPPGRWALAAAAWLITFANLAYFTVTVK